MYYSPNAKLAYKKLFRKFCDTVDVKSDMACT